MWGECAVHIGLYLVLLCPRALAGLSLSPVSLWGAGYDVSHHVGFHVGTMPVQQALLPLSHLTDHMLDL